ncbi:MAG: DUF5610 domain-containing protein [Comamonas sp.]|nr:DUF5610 domain-containing protein [Comamonas sp.]
MHSHSIDHQPRIHHHEQQRSNALQEAERTAQSRPEGQRNALNAQILEASLQVSVQAGNDGLALLYRSAVEHINELLAPELGPDAIGQAMGQDNSAEGTAGRILSMTTAFFDQYAAQHKNKDPEQVVHDFVNLIRGGFEQGYAEAADILEGLGVMGDDSPIAAGIAKTFELVQKGYDDFLANKLAELRPATDASKEGSSAASA